MMPNIVNIINFMRNYGDQESRDRLFQTSKNQVEYAKKLQLPSTSLLQYDALIDKRYTDFLKATLDANDEIGVWLEIVKPMVEKAGLVWRGRDGRVWDHHSNVGFTIGYPPSEREKLIDVCMEEFKNVFGRYPVSVGSWHIDAHSMAYLDEKYGVRGELQLQRPVWNGLVIHCGGRYYNQAYYPCKEQCFHPSVQ